MSISALLWRYYLAFTLILIAIFFGTYRLWDSASLRLMGSPKVEELLQSEAFLHGSYGGINPEKYLGVNGGFAVLDGELNQVYSSSPYLPRIDTEDELLCIREYDSMYFFSSLSFRTEDSKQRILVSCEHYEGDGLVSTDAALLDEDLRVLEGSLFPGKREFTREELGYLTGSWSRDYLLERTVASGPQGERLNVLFLLPQYSEEYYHTALQQAGRLWLLAIPLYLAATLVFIRLLNRHFRCPLSKLKAAILSLGGEESPSASGCGGPEELQELGRSFDRMAESLRESQAETQRLEQQRSKMLADISHDLKTPVTVISGYANLIRDAKLPPEELSKYLETIGRKADALAELVNSFCEYAKTEHPDFRLDKRETELCEFLREYLAEKFDEIELAGFSLEADIPEGLSLPCRLDPFQLSRALDNILSNSLKHNRLGTLIRVSLRQDRNMLLLTIADNGSGIPSNLRADLFTPFAVGDSSRSKGGSGLGLAISARIIRGHGWSIRLLEDTVPGTAFEISIPKQPGP